MIVVTGASSGIGKELAKILINQKKSESIYLISRSNPFLEGGKWLKADFRNQEELEEVSLKLKNLKEGLNFMVHCSGIMRSNPSSKLSLQDATDSFMVNCIAPIFLTSALTKNLAKAKGKVAVISSIASNLEIPGETIYSSTKAALDKGFDSLAADLSRLGICFLKIHPCLIDTPMTQHLNDSQRQYMFGCQSTKESPTAKDLAEFIANLNKSNKFITGSNLYFGGIRR